MIAMTTMTFGAPQWFEGLLLLPLLAGLFLRNEMLRDHLLGKLVAARLLPDLAASMSAPRRRWKYTLALLGLACVIVALTRPQTGYDIIRNNQRGLDLMIAVDTSRSMLSNDVQPDRLSRAKLAAQDLIESLDGDRAGLIAFAGTSFVEAPLTVDYSAVENSLTALDTDTIPRGGTNIAAAIREAADAFGTGESTHRALVLFTDGEELEDDAVKAAKEINGKFRIFTVGVGSREGSLIPLTQANGGTEFLKDDQGQYVKSHLAEETLKEIANATGGFYLHLESGPATARTIIAQGLKKMQEHEFETKERIPIERYQWPLAAGILLLIASVAIRERRRVRPVRPVRRKREAAAAATVALLLLMTAQGWSRNEGLNLYDEKNYNGAYDVFQGQLQRNPDSNGLEFDSGASAYKKGDYDKALDAFGKALGTKDPALRGEAEYNLGNTLVQRGALQDGKDEKIKEWTEALKHYDQALAVDPKNADAKYNEDVVRKMIEELNKKQPPQNQQQQQKQQQNQQQQNQQQQNQQKQNQQQQNQQQQNQQQQNQQQQNQQQQNQQKQNQQQSGAQGQPDQKPGQQKQDEQNQTSANQTKNMNGPSPSPTPANAPGVLKEHSQQDQQSAAQAAARGATEAARSGEMTPSQAQALIDSLRGEEEHVSFEDKRNNNEPVYKDW